MPGVIETSSDADTTNSRTTRRSVGATTKTGVVGKSRSGTILQISYWKGTGSQYSSTGSWVTVTNSYWQSSTYPSITVARGNWIYAILEFRYNVYGGGNDSGGNMTVYDITNSAAKGMNNGAYTAHTSNETSGIWNYQSAGNTCQAIWEDTSGAAVQCSARMMSGSGGTVVWYGDYCHMTLMELAR